MLALDHYLFQLINQVWTAPWADSFFPFITDLHKSFYFQLIVYPLFLMVFVYKFKVRGLLVFLLCALSVGATDFLGNNLFKQQFQRARPGDTQEVHAVVRAPYGGYSFISNHAANTACLAVFVSAVAPGFGGILWLLCLLTSYSRVYNGVHFPSDVLAGILFGSGVGYLFSRIVINFIIRRKKISN